MFTVLIRFLIRYFEDKEKSLQMHRVLLRCSKIRSTFDSQGKCLKVKRFLAYRYHGSISFIMYIASTKDFCQIDSVYIDMTKIKTGKVQNVKDILGVTKK